MCKRFGEGCGIAPRLKGETIVVRPKPREKTRWGHPSRVSVLNRSGIERTTMKRQTIACCRNCEKVYVVRTRDDGAFVLTTDEGRCTCGEDSFRELETTADG